MSDIRFIQAQGELLDAAITAASERQAGQETWLTRLRSRLQPRNRLAVVVVALAVAGCGVAAAATGVFSSSSARLAVGTVDCYSWSGTPAAAAVGSEAIVSGATLTAGQTPSALCRQEFESQGLGVLQRSRLIACQKNPTIAAVFIASGAADQCQQLGLAPLPRGFASASAGVHTLATQLHDLYLSRDCWQPRAFARVAKATLDKDGLTDWRVVLQKPIKTYSFLGAGQCASIGTPAPNSGNPGQSLDGSTRTLHVSLGIPRSIDKRITTARSELAAKQWSTCDRASTIRTAVDQAFASSGMTPKIAITTNPNAHGFSWGTRAEARHYRSGCLIMFNAWPTPNDRTVLVWFIARNGARIPATGHPPPLADFHT